MMRRTSVCVQGLNDASDDDTVLDIGGGIQGLPVAYCDKTKYLGVMLRSSVKFSVDLSYMKTKFYRAFNSLFHKSSKFKDELVIPLPTVCTHFKRTSFSHTSLIVSGLEN